MDRYEIAQHLADMKYKPGVTFGVRDGHHEDDFVVIWINAIVEDVDHPGNKIPLHLSESVNLAILTDLDSLKRQMRYLFIKLETHEVDEWFKFQGRCVTDPHPERHRLRPRITFKEPENDSKSDSKTDRTWGARWFGL